MYDRAMKILHYILGLAAAFALITVLLITSVEAVVYWTPGYFESEYEKHQVLDDVSMDMDELMKVTDHMMAYLRGEEQELQITATVAGAEREFFSDREIAHMIDVKNLFLGGLALRRGAAAAGLLALAILAWKRRLKVLPVSMIAAFGALLGGAAILGIVISTDFTKYFTIFHHIFFDNDLWILDPDTDLLINIVPEPFFIDTALRIGLVFGAAMILVLAVSIYAVKRWRKNAGSGAEREEDGKTIAG